MKRSMRGKVFERRREAAIYALMVWTQSAIARHARSSPGTVSRDLVTLREFWREFPVFDFRRFLEPARGSVDSAHRYEVVASKGDVVTPKYRFCATPRLEREFCVSRSCVRGSIGFRAIASDRIKLAESRKCCDASTGLDGGSGEHGSLTVNSQSFEKLRMCAMRDR
jgi:hypothetical protein